MPGQGKRSSSAALPLAVISRSPSPTGSSCLLHLRGVACRVKSACLALQLPFLVKHCRRLLNTGCPPLWASARPPSRVRVQVASCQPPHDRRCSVHTSFTLLSAVLPVHFACAAVPSTAATSSATAALGCAAVQAVVSVPDCTHFSLSAVAVRSLVLSAAASQPSFRRCLLSQRPSTSVSRLIVNIRLHRQAAAAVCALSQSAAASQLPVSLRLPSHRPSTAVFCLAFKFTYASSAADARRAAYYRARGDGFRGRVPGAELAARD